MIRMLVLSIIVVAVLVLALGGLVVKGGRRLRPRPAARPRLAI